MVLVCTLCRVHLGVLRRIPVCPYCFRQTTWIEPLTQDDQQLLKMLKITPYAEEGFASRSDLIT